MVEIFGYDLDIDPIEAIATLVFWGFGTAVMWYARYTIMNKVLFTIFLLPICYFIIRTMNRR